MDQRIPYVLLCGRHDAHKHNLERVRVGLGPFPAELRAQVQTLPTHTVTINGTVGSIDKTKRGMNIKTSDGKYKSIEHPSERDTLQ